jgi:hypothetical protein
MLQQAHHRCEWRLEDGSRCTQRRSLHVHHLTYERFHQEWPGDLLVVCATHHGEAHGHNAPQWEREPVHLPPRFLLPAGVYVTVLVGVWLALGGPRTMPLPAGDEVPWPSWADLAGFTRAVATYAVAFVVLFVRVCVGIVVDVAGLAVRWAGRRVG